MRNIFAFVLLLSVAGFGYASRLANMTTTSLEDEALKVSKIFSYC